jgi:hypothetical protein
VTVNLPVEEELIVELRMPRAGKRYDLPSEHACASFASTQGSGIRAERDRCQGSVFVHSFDGETLELTVALESVDFAGRFVFTSAPRR